MKKNFSINLLLKNSRMMSLAERDAFEDECRGMDRDYHLTCYNYDRVILPYGCCNRCKNCHLENRGYGQDTTMRFCTGPNGEGAEDGNITRIYPDNYRWVGGRCEYYSDKYGE